MGSTRTHRVDVRLVAATNRNLVDMVKRNQFRSDLYYRLNVFPVPLPPLRARRDDIPALVEHFVEIYAHRMDKQIEHIPPETMCALTSYEWPGNIRELQNFIERSVILSSGNTLCPPLESLRAAAETESLEAVTLEDAERDHIRKVLEQTRWVVAGPMAPLRGQSQRDPHFAFPYAAGASHAATGIAPRPPIGTGLMLRYRPSYRLTLLISQPSRRCPFGSPFLPTLIHWRAVKNINLH